MSIQEHLNKIRNAVYGREVRESIAKGIETAYDDASEKDNANMEVKIARGTHPNLRSRLEEVDNKQQQTTAQLAQKTNKGEISVTDIDKNKGLIDETYISDTLKQQMAGNTPIHTTPAKFSITTDKLAFSPVIGNPSKNLFDKDSALLGKYLYYNTGGMSDNPNFFVSAPIPAVPNESYYFQGRHADGRWVAYDESDNALSGGVGESDILTPDKTTYLRIGSHISTVNVTQLEKGTSFTGYEKYGATISGEALENKSVTPRTLTDAYDFRGLIDSTGDLNSVVSTGTYLVYGGVSNMPPNFNEAAIMKTSTNGRWVFQELYSISNKQDIYSRVLDTNNTSLARWIKLTDMPDDNYLTSDDDLNDYLSDGRWIAISPINAPTTGTYMLTVKTYTTNNKQAIKWGTQTLVSTSETTHAVYQRVFYQNVASVVTFGDFYRLDNLNIQGGELPLLGKTVVNLGDSIFGNTRGSNSVSNFIAERTGATTYNIGFGGSRIAQHSEYWDAFSLYRLADEIVKEDSDPTKWQYQDEAIQAQADGIVGLGGFLSYFETHLNDLKAIDFSTIDFITIAGGTNDYTAPVVLDNAENLQDTTTFAGALRYALEKIMTKHQHLKVLICTPMYRFWRQDGEYIDDGDSRVHGTHVLPDFVEKAKEVGKEFKTPVVDNYFELGINKFNKEIYFPSNDGTHPNAKGNAKLGHKIGSALISEF